MKTSKRIFNNTTAFLFIALTLNSCKDTTYEKRTYEANVPVYMSFEDMRSAVATDEARKLSSLGKIYFKDNYLFINEMNKGIHIIDNSIPSTPQNIGYINIPGNVDIAIKGDILYADSYTDLVAIDISNLENMKVTERINDVFPHVYPPYNPQYAIAQLDDKKGIVVGWKIEEITEIVEVDGNNNNKYYDGRFAGTDGGGFNGVLTTNITPGVNNSIGIGGSMARFTIYDHYLYTINNRDIRLFDLSENSKPVSGNIITTWRDIETLFPAKDMLFVGTTTGMLVYDLSTPSNPQYLSQFNHARSCDPVVVEGNYAYVTLRGGSPCGGFDNQLDVINISSITSPFLVKSYPMTEPYGLGIDNGTLFVCDGDAGLKVYNASDPYKIDENIINQFADINTYDVIPYKGLLMMIGADGLYQYTYTDSNIELLSVINVIKN